MNTPSPYDASRSLSSSSYPQTALSPYDYQGDGDDSASYPSAIAGRRCVETATLVNASSLNLVLLGVLCTSCSPHQSLEPSPEVPRRSTAEGYRNQHIFPSVSADLQSTRRASTTAIYAEASTGTTPASVAYAQPSRSVSSKYVRLSHAQTLGSS